VCKFYVTIVTIVFGFSLCFAQEMTPKIAVYVSGEESTNKMNRLLSVKLFEAMTQYGNYAGIEDQEQFQNGLARGGNLDIASIAPIARKRGADLVCEVYVAIGFGTLYSFNAYIIRTFDLKELKTASIDYSIESIDDLTAVSSELASLLFLQDSYVPSPPYVTAAMADYIAAVNPTPAAAPEQPEPELPPLPKRKKEKRKEVEEETVSFGIRAGANFSHAFAKYTYEHKKKSGDYGDIFGMQAGFAVDFPATNWFHIQPGLMYIQKGMEDGDGSAVTAHYIELPLLISLKLSALRLNAGPYTSVCLSSDYSTFKSTGIDLGISSGIGFDIGIFYLGAFYDYGFFNAGKKSKLSLYNRTLGLNFGINL